MRQYPESNARPIFVACATTGTINHSGTNKPHGLEISRRNCPPSYLWIRFLVERSDVFRGVLRPSDGYVFGHPQHLGGAAVEGSQSGYLDLFVREVHHSFAPAQQEQKLPRDRFWRLF